MNGEGNDETLLQRKFSKWNGKMMHGTCGNELGGTNNCGEWSGTTIFELGFQKWGWHTAGSYAKNANLKNADDKN